MMKGWRYVRQTLSQRMRAAPEGHLHTETTLLVMLPPDRSVHYERRTHPTRSRNCTEGGKNTHTKGEGGRRYCSLIFELTGGMASKAGSRKSHAADNSQSSRSKTQRHTLDQSKLTLKTIVLMIQIAA